MEFTLTQGTKVVAGSGCSSGTGTLLKEAGYKKAFVVYDKGIKAAGIPDKILSGIREQGIEYVCFDDVKADPPAEVVNEAADLCKKEGCDCVVAIGGGSSIDTAKGVTILRFNDGTILDYGKPGAEMKQCSGLISIPTTAGTGSELSDGLIITDTEHDVKVPILALKAMSEYAVVDPLLTLKVPGRMTMATGLDVFSHAFESYTSVKANILTEAVSEKIMEMVVTSLPVLKKNPEDVQAREKMAAASTLAGWMLAQASAHLGHSVAHVLGAHFHMVHGEACAYGLPGVMQFIAEDVPEKMKFAGKLLGAEFEGNETAEEIAGKTAEAYKHFRDQVLEVPDVSTYGKPEAEYLHTVCADALMKEPFTGLCTRKITGQDAVWLLEQAFS